MIIAVVAALAVSGFASEKPGAPPASPAAAPSPVSITSKPVERVLSLDSFLTAHALTSTQQFRSDPGFGGEKSSLNVAQVRGNLRRHFHAKTEETVLLIRGSGTMTLDDKSVEMKAGDAVQIPMGVIHSFQSKGTEPAVAVSFFAPSFDGSDRIYVNEGKD